LKVVVAVAVAVVST